jgi:hypothetical protein
LSMFLKLQHNLRKLMLMSRQNIELHHFSKNKYHMLSDITILVRNLFHFMCIQLDMIEHILTTQDLCNKVQEDNHLTNNMERISHRKSKYLGPFFDMFILAYQIQLIK